MSLVVIFMHGTKFDCSRQVLSYSHRGDGTGQIYLNVKHERMEKLETDFRGFFTHDTSNSNNKIIPYYCMWFFNAHITILYFIVVAM